jgi:SAM-dependent methyltransferase
MLSTVPDDLAAAAAAWNDPDEGLESLSARIHDGVPLDQLEPRARRYIHDFFDRFPYVRLGPAPACLEIGSGVGYIMEALKRELVRRGTPPSAITGLDIAEHMLDFARQRIGADPTFRFLHYDGITVPLRDASLDLVYSVAALQHVPKPYVYNLFLEMHRLLKPEGFGIFTLLTFKGLAVQESIFPWREEVRRQVRHERGHWHHFYSAEELDSVLGIGTGFAHVDIEDDGRGLVVCVHKQPVPMSRQWARVAHGDGLRHRALRRFLLWLNGWSG